MNLCANFHHLKRNDWNKINMKMQVLKWDEMKQKLICFSTVDRNQRRWFENSEVPSSVWTARILILVIRDMMIEKTLAALVLLGSEFFFFTVLIMSKKSNQVTRVESYVENVGPKLFFFLTRTSLIHSQISLFGKDCCCVLSLLKLSLTSSKFQILSNIYPTNY